MFEVAAGGVSVEAAQGEADGDALSEGLQMRQAQDLSQSGLTGQEKGKPSFCVPFKVGEQGEEGEDVGPEVVGFVDDEQDGYVAVFDEALDLLLDEAEGHGARPFGLEAECKGELAAEVGGVDQGVVQVHSAHLVGVEIVAQSPQGGGFAAARLAGEQADGPGVDQVAQTAVEFFEPLRPKQRVGGEGAVEGRPGEAEGGGIEVHWGSP